MNKPRCLLSFCSLFKTHTRRTSSNQKKYTIQSTQPKMELKPSEIYFSQKFLSHTFENGKLIGHVLDNLYFGNISISSIPRISGTKKPGSDKWYTLDNRRLWVFRYLEGGGKCHKIPVKQGSYENNEGKFTSTNGGVSVLIRNGEDPGGFCWRALKPSTPVEFK